jgi:hypothetical protein
VPASKTQHPAMIDSYSKCNARPAQAGISHVESTDNMPTFFLFITKAYISLHENGPAPAKFRRNGRSQAAGRENSSNLRQDLAIFDQNLAVFGKWKGGRATFHLNRDKYTSYGNWTCEKPFISFQFLSPAGTPREPEVPSSPEERSPLNARNRDGDQSSQGGNETGGLSELQPTLSDPITYKFYFLVNVSKYLTLSHSCAPDPSFFQKKKAWNLGPRREFEGVSFLNISPRRLAIPKGKQNGGDSPQSDNLIEACSP